MNFETDFEIYRQNMYPAMVGELAHDLGVSTEAVEALGVGFSPADQAWVFAERDAKGEIIGLIRRYMDGKKFAITGSKRGLTFVINQNYGTGKERYRGGRHAWYRTTKAHRCPICNRDHYCLLSKEDISNPAAVICTKVSEGAERNLVGSGWLHIRRPELSTKSEGILAASKWPILLLEGASDVLAAISLGFTAIGRPSDQGGTNFLKQLPLSGRDVIVIGENDSGAGRKGMELCYRVLKGTTKSITRLMPPEGIKDLRGWLASGVTAEEVIAAANEATNDPEDATILEDVSPTAIARRFLAENYTQDKTLQLYLYRNAWYEFVPTDNHYAVIEKSMVKKQLYRFLDGKQVVSAGAKGTAITPYVATEHKLTDIIGAMGQWCALSTRLTVPFWVSESSTPDIARPEDCLPFKNGLLDIKRYQDGEIKLYPVTANYFNFAVLPYDFDENATSPMWDKFLSEIFEGDEEKIRLLQQWFGYVITPDNSYEKMMLLTGARRSGKSTVVETMQHTCGESMCGATSFQALGSNFGLQSMVDKWNIVISDSKTSKIGAARVAMEKIMQITGNDAVYVDVKYGTPLSGVKLFTRFTLIMNGLPALVDDSRAFESRVNILKFSKSFYGHEDRTLKRRLVAEAKAGKLINFALQGLVDLRSSNNFVEPDSSITTREEFQRISSPLLVFTEECCEFGEGLLVEKSMLFKAWRAWCEDNNAAAKTAIAFGMRFGATYPDIKSIRSSEGDRRYRYHGVGLSPEIKKLMAQGGM